MDITTPQEKEVAHSSPVLLSVCIPTYNRASFLVVLVQQVLTQLTRVFSNNFEIIISDNHSTDNTQSLIATRFSDSDKVRVISPPQHYPTAEENLCFAISQCNGEYIWTLGDDDAVVPETLNSLYVLLLEGKQDLFIFNSRSISNYGDIIKHIKIPCLQPEINMNMLDFIRKTGFYFVIAGFSTTVFRKKNANINDFKKIIGISKIYSHVTWLISQFHNKHFSFVNKPLVLYRENLYDVMETGHWEKVALREKLFVGGIWSVGFLYQMDYLVELKVIERRFLKEVIDRNLYHRWYFCDEIISHMLRSLKYEGSINVRYITTSELSYFCSWLYEIDSENLYLISLFENIIDIVSSGGRPNSELLSKISHIISSRSSMKWFEHFRLYDAYGYAVFHHAQNWFAILLGEFDTVDFLMQNIDFDDFDKILFVRQSEDELLACLKMQTRRRFVNEPVKRFSLPFVMKPLPERIAIVYKSEGVLGLSKRVVRRAFRLNPR